MKSYEVSADLGQICGFFLLGQNSGSRFSPEKSTKLPVESAKLFISGIDGRKTPC